MFLLKDQQNYLVIIAKYHSCHGTVQVIAQLKNDSRLSFFFTGGLNEMNGVHIVFVAMRFPTSHWLFSFIVIRCEVFYGGGVRLNML